MGGGARLRPLRPGQATSVPEAGRREWPPRLLLRKRSRPAALRSLCGLTAPSQLGRTHRRAPCH
eukprot:9582652-Alexandrium_andersonii.AAC.1